MTTLLCRLKLQIINLSNYTAVDLKYLNGVIYRQSNTKNQNTSQHNSSIFFPPLHLTILILAINYCLFIFK